MAKISGGIPVTGFVSPTDDTDTFATHSEEYGKGGYKSVANSAERQAITFERRKEGMLVKQLDTGIFWALQGGIENTNWQVASFTSDDEKNKIALLDGTGDGTKYLSDDGTYKGVGETAEYSSLTNKPSINSIELLGNKTLEDLGIQPSGNYLVDEDYVHTDENFTTTLKTKVEGLNNYTLPQTDTDTLGGVMIDGTTIIKDENGVISSTVSGVSIDDESVSNVSTYSSSKIDGTFVKQNGTKVLSDYNYTIAEKNKLSGLNNYTLPIATDTVLGGVKVDGTSITISDGVISSIGDGGANIDDENISTTTAYSSSKIDTAYVKQDGTKVLSDVNFTNEKSTKLDGISANATANDTDVNLKNRANHTGVQAISTITDLQDTLDSKLNKDFSSYTVQETLETTDKLVINSGTTAKTVTVQQVIDKVPTVTSVTSVNTKTGDVVLDKTDIGLENVVNVDTSTTENITDFTNKRFITDSQKSNVANLSGTNTGDETAETIKTKLGAVSDTTDGYLTFEQYNALVDMSNGDMAKVIYDTNNIQADVYDRTNHTGEQAISTIADLQTNLNNLQDDIDSKLGDDFTTKPSKSNVINTDVLLINDSENSNAIEQITMQQISDLITDTRYKGNYSTYDELHTAYPTGISGEYAIANNTFWSWSVADGDWINSNEVNTVTSINSRTGDITLTKTDVGLENLTNDTQVKRAEMGIASGVATLDETGKIPTSQIPEGSGSGDMLKSTYDTTNSGIVDNAEKVNNHTVEKDVPSNAVFTDTDTTYEVATTSSNGLMGSTDKSKLDGIAKNANNYTLPEAGTDTLGGVKIDGSTITIADGVISSSGGSSSGGVKVATFTIGTSTNGWTSSDCDYLCDGTADQVEFNNAINALPSTGGKIVVLSGTYNIASKINVNKSNITLVGNGNSTVLKRKWDSTINEGVITLNLVNNCKVSNFYIDGGTYVRTTNANICINTSCSNNIITNNICNNSGGSGIIVYSSCDENTIINNICNYNEHGITISASCSNNIITNNICNNSGGSGIFLSYSDANIIIGNNCNNDNNGIQSNSSDANIITGNSCNNNDDGIHLENSDTNTITGNSCNTNNNGVYLASSNINTITENSCNNNDYGVYLGNSDTNIITGNNCVRGTGLATDYTSTQYTIYFYSTTSNYNLISSNMCMGKAVVVTGTGNESINNKYE